MTISTLTTLFATVLLGSMIFFTGIVAPLIFRRLDDEQALKFTRHLFPYYFLWGIIVSALATVSALFAKSYSSIPLLIIFAGFLYSRQILIPKITEAKDQWHSSDTAQDKARYKLLHKRSVIVNGIQILLLICIVLTTLVFTP